MFSQVKRFPLMEEKFLLAERYAGERSYSEISEMLGISEAACRKRMQRTKEHLAELVGKQRRKGGE